MLGLLEQIIGSFHSGTSGVGLPLGNLSSQLLVNIYMNEFDQFVKHTLRFKHYVRYADDFVFVHENSTHLAELIPILTDFLETRLKLTLHPDKLFLKTIDSGVDFLGWVNFPKHRVLRTTTKRRMHLRLKQNLAATTQASYLGMLSHGNTYELAQKIRGKKK